MLSVFCELSQRATSWSECTSVSSSAVVIAASLLLQLLLIKSTIPVVRGHNDNRLHLQLVPSDDHFCTKIFTCRKRVRLLQDSNVAVFSNPQFAPVSASNMSLTHTHTVTVLHTHTHTHTHLEPWSP